MTIQPPARPGGPWTIASDAADRPRRASAELDAATGRVTGVHVFADRPALDRAIGYGVAAHEGALFGLANQLLSTVTALGLMLLAGSGALLWWKRRPIGLLGAPVPAEPPRLGPGLVAGIALLGVALPVFGASLILLLLVERLALRRIVPAARWLGLRTGLDAG
ncbi:PepSY domain-containing protein [Sphingomonas morindae]|uniref:PepSY domain-containing protein n=1 Tax=Sphingomonas morindae TaxID=1541170 RepID=UPI00349E764F